MKRLTIAISILLLFVLTSSATTPTTSNASLKGTYVYMWSGAKERFWGAQLTCGGQSVFMGGSEVAMEAVVGSATFDGQGSMTGTFTDYGNFDPASSNATVSCTSNGHAVYFPPTSGTLTGTYSVQANGTGTITDTLSNGTGPFTTQISLVGNCASTGVNDAVLMAIPDSNNSIAGTGTARLQ
jgi:hypothetical protein